MRDLYFFSSNRAKLAHLKHIARRFGLEVHGFRELSYMGPYQEPQIRDRKQLLIESYQSAYEKWKKFNGENDSRIFILEDTSVSIDALSSFDEVPGVDVKYWMKDMTFQKLDQLLKDNSNNRSATVRSDLIAHIPEKLRSVIGSGDPFIWVHDETQGKITKTENSIKTNVVYPWLDGNSFNKWFIPKNYEVPMSALSIQDADKCDFRAKAFEKLVTNFQGVLAPDSEEKSVEQLLLPGLAPEPPILIIAGYSCAGKSLLATWLSDQYGLLHLEASDYMWQAYWERHGMNSNVKIIDFALEALKVEPWIAARSIAIDIKRITYPAIIITGFRSPNEIVELQKELGTDRPIQIIFIDAEFDLRMSRALERNRENQIQNKLKERDAKELEMGLDEIRLLKNISTINNNLKNEKNYFDKFLNEWEKDIISIYKMIENCPPLTIGNLEQLILLSLLNLKKDDYLTTTQIAASIQYFYGETKSKNNVSRYFNQEFHPFYKAEQIEGTTSYRLSTTGNSVAKLLETIREYNKIKF
jgi:inosine/xanthosine triphosphate pyrophosphatase family protein/adenylate kinase family enzyme